MKTPARMIACAILITLPWGAAALAQDGDKGKSLDDLLGIPSEGSQKARKEKEKAQRESLARILTQQEAQNTLKITIDSMHRSALLLAEQEAGIEVQRIQEDVLARLDVLIDSAQQQQQQQQSSSSSSSSSQSKSKDGKSSKPSGSQQGEKSEEEQRREAANQRAKSGKGDEREKSGSGDPKSGNQGERASEMPIAQDGIEGGILQETEEEWGNLPPRTREIIRQGIREKMSSVYRRWTEAYYRRIAQEGKP